MLVFDQERRLLAVLTHLSAGNEVAPGHWYLEAGLGWLDGPNHPTFADLDAAEHWICERLDHNRG
ncbi:hypothetical protein [Microvirga zambiensis]|uniref:hypothetical protein n=1 Tax=Microvirga zambiensis TaxID=1402137 RepID=UPI00191D338C|nr:hypothetical protein [Microvirga zambiensis]